MSFTAEEVWTHMGKPDSVHMALFPEPTELLEGIPESARQRSGDWDKLLEVRDSVLKSLEAARNSKLIGAPLEAAVRLRANGDLYPLLEKYAAELPALFIVSQVELSNMDGGGPSAETSDASHDNLQVTVERASGAKCVRCWKYTLDV